MVVKTGMLVRKPAARVFEAFVDPEITRHFWFTKGSERLETGKKVRWDWEMYGVFVPVTVEEVTPHERIAITWPGEGGDTRVVWTFTPQGADATFVEIECSGFHGDRDAVAKQAVDSSEGFSLALAGLKAYLEHGIELGLVRDRFPK